MATRAGSFRADRADAAAQRARGLRKHERSESRPTKEAREHNFWQTYYVGINVMRKWERARVSRAHASQHARDTRDTARSAAHKVTQRRRVASFYFC